VEAISAGCLPKMRAILSAQLHGGWLKIEKCSDSSTFAQLNILDSSILIGEGDVFFDSPRLAELAGSVLHETCRYRSGEERDCDML
jgi:hypothetical protein